MNSRWMPSSFIIIFLNQILILLFRYHVVPARASEPDNSCYVYGEGEDIIDDCSPSVYIRGSNAILGCGNTVNSNSESNVEWHKDGEILFKGNSTLVLTNLTVSNIGQYSCMVDGRVLSSYTVKVKDITGWRLPTPSCFTRLKGIYNCSWSKLQGADGPDGLSTVDIPTRYQWQFELDIGDPVEIFPINPKENFSLIEVKVSSGRYFVSFCAVNCFGQFLSSPQQVSFLEKVRPFPPTNIQLSPVSVNQMRISFDTPATWSEYEMCYVYRVTQERTGLSSWQVAEEIQQRKNSFIFDVIPNKPYSLVCVTVAAISCIDPHEDLEYSSEVCSHTNMSAPSSGPPRFTFTSMPQGLEDPNIRTVTLTWEHLGPDTANGVITNYVVILSSNSSQCDVPEAERIIQANETEYTIKGLLSYCPYRAELYAENVIGRSPASAITIISLPHPVNVVTPVVIALILLSVVGLCLVIIRLSLFLKDKVLPEVPEPSHKHQLWKFKINSPVTQTEEEIFDKLPCLERGISVNTQSSEESDVFYQETRLTRTLLSTYSNKKQHDSQPFREHYITMKASVAASHLTSIHDETAKHLTPIHSEIASHLTPMHDENSFRKSNEPNSDSHPSQNEILHTSREHESNMPQTSEDSAVYILSQRHTSSLYKSKDKGENEPFLKSIAQDPYVTEAGLFSLGKDVHLCKNENSNIPESQELNQVERDSTVPLTTHSNDADISSDAHPRECDALLEERDDSQTARRDEDTHTKNLNSCVNSSSGYVSENSIKMVNQSEKGSYAEAVWGNDYIQEKSLLRGEIRIVQCGLNNKVDVNILDDPYLDEEVLKVDDCRCATKPPVISTVLNTNPYIQI